MFVCFVVVVVIWVYNMKVLLKVRRGCTRPIIQLSLSWVETEGRCCVIGFFHAISSGWNFLWLNVNGGAIYIYIYSTWGVYTSLLQMWGWFLRIRIIVLVLFAEFSWVRYGRADARVIKNPIRNWFFSRIISINITLLSIWLGKFSRGWMMVAKEDFNSNATDIGLGIGQDGITWTGWRY